MSTFSREAIERPYRTLQAVEVLRKKAEVIERVAARAGEDEIVIVVVQHNLEFGGVWTLAREDIAQQIKIVEDEGGWSLIFSPRTSRTQVEQRCNELAGIAQKRWEAMQHWANRHPEDAHE